MEKLLKKIFSSKLMPFCLLFLCVFLIPRAGVHEVGDNTIQYFDEALKYYKGEAPILQILRGPGLPLFISLSFVLFGVSVKSAFLMIKIIHLLLIVSSYFLYATLFGGFAAFFSILLIISCWPLDMTSVWIMPDLPASFFAITNVLFCYLAYRNKSKFYIVLAGLFMGLAFLTKEYVVLFFLLPVLINLKKDYRFKEYLSLTLLYYLIAFLVVLPWAYYLVNVRNYPFYSLLGYLSPAAKGDYIGKSSFLHSIYFVFNTILHKGLKGSYGFIHTYIKNHFVLYPFLLISWIYGFYRWFKTRSLKYSILIFSLILFYPVLIALGLYSMGTRQGTIFYYLSFVMLSGFLVSFCDALTKKIKFLKNKKHLLSLILIGVLILFQMFNTRRSTYRLWRQGAYLENYFTFPLTFGLNKDEFKVRGAHRNEMRYAANWIKKNIPQGSNALVAIGYKEGLNLFLGFDYFKEVTGFHDYWNRQVDDLLSKGVLQRNEKIVAIWPYGNFKGKQERYRGSTIFYRYESFFDVFKKADYLLFSKKGFYEQWFSQLSFLTKEYESETICIYSVDRKQQSEIIREQEKIINSTDNPLYIKKRLVDYVEWLKKEDPAMYEKLLSQFKKINLNLEDAMKKGILWK